MCECNGETRVTVTKETCSCQKNSDDCNSSIGGIIGAIVGGPAGALIGAGLGGAAGAVTCDNEENN